MIPIVELQQITAANLATSPVNVGTFFGAPVLAFVFQQIGGMMSNYELVLEQATTETGDYEDHPAVARGLGADQGVNLYPTSRAETLDWLRMRVLLEGEDLSVVYGLYLAGMNLTAPVNEP